MIVLTARQRLKKEKKQFYHHKHLLISSIILAILTLPRVIISSLPNCIYHDWNYFCELVFFSV